MKTTAIRAIVMSLTLAGFAATALPTKAPAKTTASVLSSASNFSGFPAPLCAPSDPSHCGMQ